MAKTYKVTVQRIVVQEFTCEVEAENEDSAILNGIEESECASMADWTNQHWDLSDEPRVMLLHDDGEDEDPMDDFNYVGSRHHY